MLGFIKSAVWQHAWNFISDTNHAITSTTLFMSNITLWHHECYHCCETKKGNPSVIHMAQTHSLQSHNSWYHFCDTMQGIKMWNHLLHHFCGTINGITIYFYYHALCAHVTISVAPVMASLLWRQAWHHYLLCHHDWHHFCGTMEAQHLYCWHPIKSA